MTADRATPARATDREVVLFGRAGCCLCDDAREVLLRVRRKHPFSFIERDIEDDETLLRAYLERIPVVTIDGVEAFELFVDETELARRIDRRTGNVARAGNVACSGDDERLGTD